MEFYKRYRFSKEIVRDVIMQFITINHENNRGLPIPPIIQLLTTLRFYANSNFQVINFRALVILLGDGGYACKPYLFTPLRNPITPTEQKYNKSHIRTRNIIERAFGLWKRKFPCLKKRSC